MIKLTIITVTYNRAHCLEDNFNSVVHQSYKNIEHIIIDNMSDDETEELVQDYIKKANYKVIYIREPDKGIYNAINKGLRIAKGEWIHILHSDDRYYTNSSLRELFRAKDHNDYDLLVSPIIVGDVEHNRLMHEWIPVYNKDYNHYDFPHLGTVIKSVFYQNHGYYSENYKIVSDAIFNITNYNKAKYKILDKPLVLMSNSGISSVDALRSIYEKAIVLIFYHKFPFFLKCKLLFQYFVKVLKLFIKKFRIRVLSKIMRKIKYALFEIAEIFKPYIRSKKYMGFDLFYSKGTSLIKHLIEGGYEKDLCDALIDDLIDTNAICFLDIGSNIGLISLYVLSKLPAIKIYAFEPGPHQFELFKKTIKINKINDIILYNKALSNKTGVSKFATHDSKDVSGDGFFDTGRAGNATIIDVPVVTIDEWWHENGRPNIKVVKIDTEGSELWILKGARAFLGKCKPNIYIEIWPDNLSAYPYDAFDILKWLNNNGYNLYTLAGDRVTLKNLSKYLGVIATFVAKSKR